MKQSTLRFVAMGPSIVFVTVLVTSFQLTLRRSFLSTACSSWPYLSIPSTSSFFLLRASRTLLAASSLLQLRKTSRRPASVSVLSFMSLAMPDDSKYAGNRPSSLRIFSISLLSASDLMPQRATVLFGCTLGGIVLPELPCRGACCCRARTYPLRSHRARVQQKDKISREQRAAGTWQMLVSGRGRCNRCAERFGVHAENHADR